METSKFGPTRTGLSATWLTPFQVKGIPVRFLVQFKGAICLR
jgi:hypothetical protein